jgi:tetratricopeptide (TPR) repeat protein
MPSDDEDPWEDFLHLPGGNLFYQGYCQFYAGEDEVSIDLAVHYFQRAIEKAKEVKGSFYPFNYYLALAYEANKQYDKALETFMDLLERFKPDEMRFKEIVKFYQPLQASASEIRSEIDRLEKIQRGAPVHSLFIDRYRALAEEVNRQKEMSERSKDEERIRRRQEGIWEEDPEAEVEVGKEVTVEVDGENLNEEVLGDLNSHFWMNFEFVGEEVPGFGFYWAEKDTGGTIMGNAQVDSNAEVFVGIVKAVIGVSKSFPELKFYIECTEAEGSIFGTEILLQNGEWVIYKDKIAEFISSIAP